MQFGTVAPTNLTSDETIALFPSLGHLEEDGRTWRIQVHGEVFSQADRISLGKRILLQLLQLLTYALIGRALLSWFDPRGQWTITRMLAEVTDPVIAPLRRVIPPVGMLDLSFIVAIILIQVLQRLLQQALL